MWVASISKGTVVVREGEERGKEEGFLNLSVIIQYVCVCVLCVLQA